MSGRLRFSQICRLLPSVTHRMLTNQLRELEADGLVGAAGLCAWSSSIRSGAAERQAHRPKPSNAHNHLILRRRPLRLDKAPGQDDLACSQRLAAAHKIV